MWILLREQISIERTSGRQFAIKLNLKLIVGLSFWYSLRNFPAKCQLINSRLIIAAMGNSGQYRYDYQNYIVETSWEILNYCYDNRNDIYKLLSVHLCNDRPTISRYVFHWICTLLYSGHADSTILITSKN